MTPKNYGASPSSSWSVQDALTILNYSHGVSEKKENNIMSNFITVEIILSCSYETLSNCN